MSKYEIILFDLDGTLTDPKIGITRSVQYALKKFGIAEDNLDKLEPFIGPPLSGSFREFYSFDEAQAVQAVKYYREYFSSAGKYENSVYPGIEDMLRELKKAGKELIVATSKPTVFSEDILKHFNLYDYFDSIVGSNMDGTRVDKSDVIRFIISSLKPKTMESIVMVGDRKYDVCGARENGISAIAVSYGYGPENELFEAGPDFTAHSVDELKMLLL